MPTREQLPRNSESPSGGGDTGGVPEEGLEVLLEVRATDLSSVLDSCYGPEMGIRHWVG